MKKDNCFYIFICGSVDIFLTFMIFCWLLFISQGNNLIQWIIVIIAFVTLFSKIFFWDRMLKKGGINRYINPEVSLDVGGKTFKVKYESEELK